MGSGLKMKIVIQANILRPQNPQLHEEVSAGGCRGVRKHSLHEENRMRFASTLVLLTLAVTWWSCSSSSPPDLPPGALAERPDPLREFAGT